MVGFDVGSLFKIESLEATKSLTDIKYDFKDPTGDGGVSRGFVPDIKIDVPDIGEVGPPLKTFGEDIVSPKTTPPTVKLDLDLDINSILNSKLSKNFWKKNRDWV
ncbi:hypothetical protein [Methanococcus maripaludis]|uniref:Uncharacterized protein n=1 Tax=Methanococcus maripaludis TaxID=39152 RepID=A0A7J9PLM2_METMI|nr:hypothetical protein [Methanococcus maripaludis]MBA2863991.1 hypothetical protein [Methanococcus maripaludis]